MDEADAAECNAILRERACVIPGMTDIQNHSCDPNLETTQAYVKVS
jgi:hypothetical protein